LIGVSIVLSFLQLTIKKFTSSKKLLHFKIVGFIDVYFLTQTKNETSWIAKGKKSQSLI
jgi:hypothetical protein